MFTTETGSPVTMLIAATKPVRSLRPAVLSAAVVVVAGAAAPSFAAAEPSPHAKSSAMVSCQPVLVKSTYGGRIARNSHLSLIRHGKVRGINAHTGASTMVRFRNGSGRWLESKSGARYAMANQPLYRNGRPGGPYVIAAKLNTDRSVACAGISELRVHAADTASVAADGSLPEYGYTETSLSASNVNGKPLLNHTTLEVCGKTPTHFDGATLTRHPATDVWCYKGAGAYLNDPYGMERDQFGNYVSGSAGQYRHFVNYNGATVAGAKRPAVRPDTGAAFLNTPIVWRIVAPKVVTTNGFGF